MVYGTYSDTTTHLLLSLTTAVEFSVLLCCPYAYAYDHSGLIGLCELKELLRPNSSFFSQAVEESPSTRFQAGTPGATMTAASMFKKRETHLSLNTTRSSAKHSSTRDSPLQSPQDTSLSVTDKNAVLQFDNSYKSANVSDESGPHGQNNKTVQSFDGIGKQNEQDGDDTVEDNFVVATGNNKQAIDRTNTNSSANTNASRRSSSGSSTIVTTSSRKHSAAAVHPI